jgi:hypothetical protein
LGQLQRPPPLLLLLLLLLQGHLVQAPLQQRVAVQGPGLVQVGAWVGVPV